MGNESSESLESVLFSLCTNKGTILNTIKCRFVVGVIEFVIQNDVNTCFQCVLYPMTLSIYNCGLTLKLLTYLLVSLVNTVVI